VIPSRITVLAMVVPLLFGMAAAFDASLVWPMLATDGGIVLALLVDGALARGRLVEVERRVGVGVFSVARPNPVTLELRSRSRRPLWVEVIDDLFESADSSDLPLRVDLPPRGRTEARYRVVPHRRGAYALGDHWVRHRSPLGLWIRQHRIRAHDAIRVFPDVEAVRAFELLAKDNRELEMLRATRIRGGQSEFECLREYTRDDEYRCIDWKATAHKRKLIARQYQLERNQTVMLALDSGRLMTARVEGLPLFDHALNSALMLGHVAARTGDHVGLFTYADDVQRYVSPRGGRGVARDLVRATYDVHPSLVESSVQTAFLRMGKRLRKRSLVILMTQVIDDRGAQELLRTVHSLHPRHLALCVVFRDTDLEGLAVDEAVRRGGACTAASAAELLAWRDRLLRDLRKAGALVLDIEPRALTVTLINRYLDIKVRRLL
jgi:uncharacterized protein (DUF58 family)